MDFQVTIVVDQAQFLEFVHEETDARPGRSYHLRERLSALLFAAATFLQRLKIGSWLHG
jgi:hypothetical protein